MLLVWWWLWGFIWNFFWEWEKPSLVCSSFVVAECLFDYRGVGQPDARGHWASCCAFVAHLCCWLVVDFSPRKGLSCSDMWYFQWHGRYFPITYLICLWLLFIVRNTEFLFLFSDAKQLAGRRSWENHHILTSFEFVNSRLLIMGCRIIGCLCDW